MVKSGRLNDDLEGAWREYGASRSQESKDALTLYYHRSLVVPSAKVVSRRIFSGSIIDEDDLVQVGDLGLLSALPRYDPKRDAQFETYGGRRIRGRMFDLLRGSGAKPSNVLEEHAAPIYEAEPQTRILRESVRDYLLDQLPPEECLVTSLYFYLGFNTEEIAGITGLKPWKVVNFKNSAIDAIRQNPRHTRQELAYLLAG